MRQSLLLLFIFAAILSAAAKDNLKVRCVSEGDNRPVAFAVLTVEYPDTIVTYHADRKGKASFSPSSYPLTVTARAEGMFDSTVGLMSRPGKALVVQLAPDPSRPRPSVSRRVDWSTDRPRRLGSTYIVRTPAR